MGSACCSIGFAEARVVKAARRRGGGEGFEGADCDGCVRCAAAVVGGCAGGGGCGGGGGVWVGCGYCGGGCAVSVVGVEFGGGRWVLRQGSAQLRAAFPKQSCGTESIHEI